jgi:hypothetical protein
MVGYRDCLSARNGYMEQCAIITLILAANRDNFWKDHHEEDGIALSEAPDLLNY